MKVASFVWIDGVASIKRMGCVNVKNFKVKNVEVEAVQWGTEEAAKFLKGLLIIEDHRYLADPTKSNLIGFSYEPLSYAAIPQKITLELRASFYRNAFVDVFIDDWIFRTPDNELIVLSDKSFKAMFDATAP